MNRSLGIAAALALGLTTLAGTARASTPPMSDEELLAASDLVLDARVVTAECAAPASVSEFETVSMYLSTLEALEVIQGELPEKMVLRGFLVEGEEAGCDERPRALGPGFEGRLYLVELEAGLYEPTHWSGVVQSETSVSEPLGTCSGPVGPEERHPPLDEGMMMEDDEEGMAACSTRPGRASGGLGVVIIGLVLGLAGLRRSKI